jgi:ABC-type phosphate/phosphonate transport system substrate-binding protein
MPLRISRRAFAFSALSAGAGWMTSGHRLMAAEKADLELKMGMLQGMFRDVPPAMVQALSKPFRELIQKQTGFTGDVDLCKEPIELVNKLREKKVHLGVFHGFEFAWAQKLCPELQPLVVTMPVGNKVQAMVVVNCECKFTKLADLADETVAVPRGAKAHAIAYFEKQRAGMPPNCAKPVTKLNLAPDEVLGAVASGEVTAALVDIGAFEGYQTLQPGVFKQLKILHQSEMFPQAVVAYPKGAISEADAQRLRDGLATANKTTSGKMMMTLWNLKGFEVPPADYQQRLDAILKAYPLPVSK